VFLIFQIEFVWRLNVFSHLWLAPVVCGYTDARTWNSMSSPKGTAFLPIGSPERWKNLQNYLPWLGLTADFLFIQCWNNIKHHKILNSGHRSDPNSVSIGRPWVFYGLTVRKPSFFRLQIFRNTYGSVLSDRQNWQILLEKFSLAGEPVLSKLTEQNLHFRVYRYAHIRCAY
jgi:hypothetical protein